MRLTRRKLSKPFSLAPAAMAAPHLRLPTARAALLLSGFLALTAGAVAAPFDNLKEDLSSCLRFEADAAKGPRPAPIPGRAEIALRKCAGEMDRLERADPRRLRSDHGLSPSTWAVIESVFGAGSRGRIARARF